MGPSQRINSRDNLAALSLDTTHPRVGRPLRGSVWPLQPLPDGVTSFWVQLRCVGYYLDTPDDGVEDGYRKSVEARLTSSADGDYLPFSFEIPLYPPGTLVRRFGGGSITWELTADLYRGRFSQTSVFDIEVAGVPEDELRALESTSSAEAKARTARVDQNARDRLLPHEFIRLSRILAEKLGLDRDYFADSLYVHIRFVLDSLVFLMRIALYIVAFVGVAFLGIVFAPDLYDVFKSVMSTLQR